MNNQIIQYNGSSWDNVTPTFISSSAIQTSTDWTTTGSLTSGDIIQYNGTNFTNVTPLSGGTVTMVNTGTGLTGGPITSTGTISISNTGVIAGLYTNPGIFINAQGQIMTASSGPTPILSVTGVSPISSSGGTNPSISLLDTAVTPSTYSYPTITVDQKGRITNASSNTPVLSVSGTSGNISSTGGQNPVLDLIPTGVTANSYTNMNATVDVNG